MIFIFRNGKIRWEPWFSGYGRRLVWQASPTKKLLYFYNTGHRLDKLHGN